MASGFQLQGFPGILIMWHRFFFVLQACRVYIPFEVSGFEGLHISNGILGLNVAAFLKILRTLP